jgi:flagellar biogenesis protein FliO
MRTEWRSATGELAGRGFVGRFFQMWTKHRAARFGGERRMELLETLSLGGKRQVQLVRCGDEQFLMGGSLESVETIVKISGAIDQYQGYKKGASE